MNGCPLCGGREVGRVGNEQYYCSNCCIEYDSKNKMYTIEEDGTLIDLDQQSFIT